MPQKFEAIDFCIHHVSTFFHKVRTNRFYAIKVAFVLLLALFLILFYKYFFYFLLITSTIIVSFISGTTGAKRAGIELFTLTTVVGGVAGGPLVGFFLGLTLCTIHFLLSGTFGVFVLWVIPLYCLVGFVSGILGTAANIASLGITLVLLVQIICFFFTFLLAADNLAKFLFFAICNILLNYLLFTFFASFILRLLGG